MYRRWIFRFVFGLVIGFGIGVQIGLLAARWPSRSSLSFALMAALDLPPHNAALFSRVRGPLAKHLGGERHLCLGGGTALAVRWAHRHSTDLDFFVDSNPYSRLYANADAFKRDLARSAGGLSTGGISPGSATIILADGAEISLSATLPRMAHPHSVDTIRGSTVPLQENEEILARKIGGRMLINNVFVPRDLYDIAVAKHYDPLALERALRHFRPDELEQIRDELRELPRDWLANQSEQILHPARPLTAEQCVQRAAEIIEPPRSLQWTR